MALIRVTDRDGVEHEVDGNTQFTLMENLRDLDYGVAAICGGMCSCATCHVWVDPQWLAKLPAPHSDETDMLRDLSTYKEYSRLSCQIKFTESLAGLAIRIADDE
jgi:2Fe-2S ferredoxin